MFCFSLLISDLLKILNISSIKMAHFHFCIVVKYRSLVLQFFSLDLIWVVNKMLNDVEGMLLPT